MLRQYLALSFDSLSYSCYVKNSLLFDCYLRISCAFTILFHGIVILVSRARLGFSFIRLLCQCLAFLQDSLSWDCYVSISRTFKLVFHSISTSGSRTFNLVFHSIITSGTHAPLSLSFIRLLRQDLTHFSACLSFDYYVRISRTFKSLSFDCYFSLSRTLRFSLI